MINLSKHVFLVFIFLAAACNLRHPAAVSDVLSQRTLPKIDRLTYSGIDGSLDLRDLIGIDQRFPPVVTLKGKKIRLEQGSSILKAHLDGFLSEAQFVWMYHPEKELLEELNLKPSLASLSEFKTSFFDYFSGITQRDLLDLVIDDISDPDGLKVILALTSNEFDFDKKRIEWAYQRLRLKIIRSERLSSEALSEALPNLPDEVKSFGYAFFGSDLPLGDLLDQIKSTGNPWPFLRHFQEGFEFELFESVLAELGLSKNSPNEYHRQTICDATVFFLGRMHILKDYAEPDSESQLKYQFFSKRNDKTFSTIKQFYLKLAGPELELEPCMGWQMFDLLDAYLHAEHLTLEQHEELVEILSSNGVELESLPDIEHEVFGYCYEKDVKSFIEKIVTDNAKSSGAYSVWNGTFSEINKKRDREEDPCSINLVWTDQEGSYRHALSNQGRPEDHFKFYLEIRYLPPTDGGDIVRPFRLEGELSELMTWVRRSG